MPKTKKTDIIPVKATTLACPIYQSSTP